MCVNVSCEAYGSRELHAALAAGLEDSGVELKTIVCFGACEHASNIVLYPKGTWYSHVQESDIPDILAHIRGGEPVQRLMVQIDPKLRELIMSLIDAGLD